MDRVAPKAGKPGRSEAISDAAIQFCLVVLFALPLLQETITVQSSCRDALPGHRQHRHQVRKRRRSAGEEARDLSPSPNRKVDLALDAAAKGSHRTARTVASGRSLWQEDGPAARARNAFLRSTRCLGWRIWRRLSGDRVRSRIEARIWGLASFGERIASRHPDCQTAEIHTRIVNRVALMKRFNALGVQEPNKEPASAGRRRARKRDVCQLQAVVA